MRSRLLRIAAIAALSLAGTTASAQELNPLEQRGRALLTKLCSNCHAVGRTGRSPRVNAPPFRSIAQRYDIADLVEQFAGGFTGPHPDMPTFTFSRDARNAVRAYLYAIQE